MSDQSGQAGASAAAAGTATGVLRIHLGHVAENLTLSFLLGGAAAALTQGLMPDSLVQNLTLRLIIAVVPLILCVMITRYRARHDNALVAAGPADTLRALLSAYAGLMGVASGLVAAGMPLISVPRAFLVVAIAFAAVSVWGRAMRRELPPRVEPLIQAWIVILVGAATAFVVEIIAWPDGIEYFKYAAGIRPALPADTTSGGYDWAFSFLAVSHFALGFGVYARGMSGAFGPKRDEARPAGVLESPLLPTILRRDDSMESRLALLAASAIFSRIMVLMVLGVIAVLGAAAEDRLSADGG